MYGPSAWDEIVHMEVQMRKEQKRAVYEAEEARERLITIVVGTIAILVVFGVSAFIIYAIGENQGKW